MNTSSCCNSAGNGPASSTPGAIRALIRNTPSSTSPLATADAICRQLLRPLSWPSSLRQYRSDRTLLSHRRRRRWRGQSRSTARRAGFSSTRRECEVGLGRAGADDNAIADAGDIDSRPGVNRAFAAASLNTSTGTTARSSGAPEVDLLDQVGRGVEVNDKLVAGRAFRTAARFAFSGPVMEPPAIILSSAAWQRATAATWQAAMRRWRE